MAAIGKIRSWGPVLVSVIGLALFAFIAEEMFRSCEATNNEQRQQVGEVLGKKISVQEFQSLIDEYQEVIKMTQGRDNLSEDEINQIKDQVWNSFVSNTIISAEAAKIGLTVTDEELQNILKEGTNPLLAQTPFVNQQTGRFDVTMLTKFLNDYKNIGTQNPQAAEQYESIYNYWKFMERTLREQTLAMKYNALMAGCLFSNPVSAKMSFDDQNTNMNILLASAPYSSINDNKVEVTDADLKAKYEEDKKMYEQFVESRDIKYVSFEVLPSAADRNALVKTMNEAAAQLKGDADVATTVRKAQSQIPYTGILVTRKAMPMDIAAKVDSMSAGQVSAVFETTRDNTLNVVKLIAKTSLPDSVEYRQIQVSGTDADDAHKRADSIMTALSSGADFEALAKKYMQEGKKQWMTSAMYENAQTIDTDSKNYISSLNTLGVNELKNIVLSQGNIIIQVTARRAMVDKYDVAVVKHTIDFSKNTYSDAYNKFSQFVSENQTVDGIEKNAEKYGYRVMERADITNAEHNVAGIRSTRETMKWLFDAKVGDVSPLYECGSNNTLLVVALTKIHPVGFRTLDDVKDVVKNEVIRDKKFEMLAKQYAGVKSIVEAKAKGMKVDTVPQITFSAPVFVQATGSSEPALSGAVAAAKAGSFSQKVVKGNGGAYLFELINKEQKPNAKFDEKAMESQLRQMAVQASSRYMNELYMKAKVVDNRYLFF